MATYAIGDIQGCGGTLRRLVRRLGFDPAKDRLWIVGDLVNRGPTSLDALRFLYDHRESVVAVLGNHDLHLLSRAESVATRSDRDTLDPVLEAPDRDELIDWVRGLPLMHREGPWVLVHAGLLPQWTVEQAEALAREAEAALRGPERSRILVAVRRGPVPVWNDSLTGDLRLRAIVQGFTRLRAVTGEGRLCDGFTGHPAAAPPGCIPWFDVPWRRSAEQGTVIFGHWAALGLYDSPGAIGLDSGCVWGGSLTAMRLEDRTVFQQPLCD